MTLLRKRLPVFALEIAMWLLALVIIVPFLVMLLGSLKTSVEATSFDLSLPSDWQWQNYPKVIAEGKMVRAFMNGMLITGAAVLLNILCASMAAFFIARRKTNVTELLYYFFFIGMLAPMQTIPTIKLMQGLSLYGTYFSAILLYCIINLSFSIFLYVGFIRTTVPKELDEAALLDGAGVLRLFFSIVFPLLQPVNMTILVIVFMNIWNDVNIPIFFLNDPRKWTMPLSVYQFFGMYSGSNWNLVFANLVLTALPVLVIYLFCQRYIVSGMTTGAVKS